MSLWRASQRVHRLFYNRSDELRGLKESLTGGRDGKMVLITGPRNSGKSALLREFVDWQCKEKMGNPIYINMRSGTFNTARSFASELKAQTILSYVPAVASICDSVLSGQLKETVDGGFPLSEGIKMQAKMLKGFVTEVENTQDTDMLKLIKRLEGLFLNSRVLIQRLGYGADAGFPTLIIDEANRLHEWSLSTEEQQNLSTLQAWLIMITKEMGLANTVLCSSEDFFRVWMNTHVGSSERYLLGIVGDLTEDEALEYFKQQLLFHRECKFSSTYKLPDGLWKDIHGYVGGRVSTLKLVADQLSWALEDEDGMRSRWSNFLFAMRILSKEEMMAGFFPESAPVDTLPLWTAQEYAAVLKAMEAAQDGVVSKDALLRDKIISKIGLFSLIQHNFLHFREVGLWGGKDLKWFTGQFPIVMPTSRPRFHAIKEILLENP